MKFKHWFTMMALLSVIALLVAACGGGAAPAEPQQAAEPADEEAAAPAEGEAMEEMGPVTLRFLTINDEDNVNAWKEILEEFKKIEDGKYAEVDIQFESVPSGQGKYPCSVH